MNDLHLPWIGQAEREADEQARRDAADLVAPEPVCTCDPDNRWAPCSIHRWTTTWPSTAEAPETSDLA